MPSPSNTRTAALAAQNEFFNLLDELFQRVIGKTARDFASPDNFPNAIRQFSPADYFRFDTEYPHVIKSLRDHYSNHRTLNADGIGMALGGYNVLLAGSSRLLGTQIDAVRGATLWTDTIFIRDPVFPWIETDRSEERHKRVLLIQAIHALLHLKELSGVSDTSPPIIVYPAREGTRNQDDMTASRAADHFFGSFFSKFIGAQLAGFEEAMQFAKRNPDQFIDAVESNNLFVPPGGTIGMPTADALSTWHDNNKTWRTPHYLEIVNSLPTAGQIALAITERLESQFKSTDSAVRLGANPLYCIEAQAHYFNLATQVDHSRLSDRGLLDDTSIAMITALGSKELSWLSAALSDRVDA